MQAFTSFDAFRDHLSRGVYAPVYCLEGSEPFFLEQAAGCFRDQISPTPAEGFDCTSVYGNETSLQQVLSIARKRPMLSPFQVIMVRGADQLPDWGRKESEALFTRYLESPADTTILVLIAAGAYLTRKGKSGKQLPGKAIVYVADKLRGAALTGWLRQQAAAQGKDLPASVAELCISLVGEDLSLLQEKLRHAILHLREGEQHISEKEVYAAVGGSAETSPFDLQRALSTKSYDRVYRLVHHCIAAKKQHPLLLHVHLLSTFYWRLLLLQGLPARERSRRSSQLLGLPPGAARLYVQALSHYSPEQLRQAIHVLHHTDAIAKGQAPSPFDEEETWRQLISGLLAESP